MRLLQRIDPGWGVAVVRVMMGVILVVAGYQKLVAGFGDIAGFLGQLGLPNPQLLAPLLTLLELGGGLLLILGLGVRPLGLLFALEFTAIPFLFKLRAMGWDATRVDFLMLACGLMLLLSGPGRLALSTRLWPAQTASAPRDATL